MYSSVIQ
jgi:carboxypeptidase C (cathepsin A)